MAHLRKIANCPKELSPYCKVLFFCESYRCVLSFTIQICCLHLNFLASIPCSNLSLSWMNFHMVQLLYNFFVLLFVGIIKWVLQLIFSLLCHLLHVTVLLQLQGIYRWQGNLPELKVRYYYWLPHDVSHSKSHSEPNRPSKMELFAKIINCFCKKFRLRCLTGFWIRLWNFISNA